MVKRARINRRTILKGRCKIIVDYGHEGQWTSEVFHKWYDDLVAKNVIDVSQIYFFICDVLMGYNEMFMVMMGNICIIDGPMMALIMGNNAKIMELMANN